MATEIQIQIYDEIIKNYISFASKFLKRSHMSRRGVLAAFSDAEMRIARMGLSVDEVGEKYTTDDEKMKGCQLHEAARNGDHVLAVQLLQSNPNLMFYRLFLN